MANSLETLISPVFVVPGPKRSVTWNVFFQEVHDFPKPEAFKTPDFKDDLKYPVISSFGFRKGHLLSRSMERFQASGL
jgi:hypothetical protein